MTMTNKTPTIVTLKKQSVIVFVATFLFLIVSGCQYTKRGIPEYQSYANDFYMEPEEPESNKPDFNTEEYDLIEENPFRDPLQNPLSTFSIDVDNASFSNVRRFLNENMMPPKDAVRIEEMINYFDYEYPQPKEELPFSITTEISPCPWNTNNKLLMIGLQGRKLDLEDLRPSNLVFLIDVSGSMGDLNKLSLVKKSLNILINQLDELDRIAIVVYAGAAGLVLPSTPASDKDKIRDAIKKLGAGGSTAGGEGIELAYKVALENLIPDGNNRVILSTDGDFNVGVSSTSEMVRMIEEKRQKGIYLTICGYGMGNYKDGRMEQISNAGNGNYFYIDNINEAEKVFKKDIRANLFTIAKDVKIQIEFNPNLVKQYRLIGYENRVMNREDFDDDLKDAGELGAGHSVTALYEIVTKDPAEKAKSADGLKYQDVKVRKNTGELASVKLRYKPIDSENSLLLTRVIEDTPSMEYAQSSQNLKLSAVVAGFGMMLRDSQYKSSLTYLELMEMSADITLSDSYRSELKDLIKTASLLDEGI